MILDPLFPLLVHTQVTESARYERGALLESEATKWGRVREGGAGHTP